MDVGFHYETLIYSKKYILCNEPLYFYRRWSGQSINSSKNVYDAINAEKFFYRRIIKNKDLWKKIREGFINALMAHMVWNDRRLTSPKANKKFRAAARKFISKIDFGGMELSLLSDDRVELLSSLLGKKLGVVNRCATKLRDFKSKWFTDYVMYPPHCVDWLGSFKNYILEHNMFDIIRKIKHNLDEKSCQCVDLFLSRVMLLPDSSKHFDFLLSRNLVKSLYTAEELEVEKEYENLLPELKKDFNLLGNKMLVETFYFHNGLRFCNDKMKAYIQDKDFIDGGAWVGDSVLVFNKYYRPRKVYSFEISEKLIDQYVDVMKINNVPDDKYEIVRYGLSDKRDAATFFDSADTGTSLLNQGENNAQVISVDEFVRDRDLKIGFLKIDVEGSGYEALKGSAETIKRDRPIICLAVYHSPHEFF